MGTYLQEHEPASPQYRSPRRERLSGIVFVHTAESIMDTVGPDTGAENVASFISRRTDPGSYHVLVDSDSVVRLVPDDCEAFQVAANGHNRHGWGISFACSATDLDPDDPWTRKAMALAAGEILAFWARNDIDSTVAARFISRADADARRGPGLVTHGDVQPGDRSDAWTTHPRRGELERMLLDLLAPSPEVPQEDDMAGKWHLWTHEARGAQFAVLEQGGVIVGKAWISHPDYVGVLQRGELGPFDASDAGENNGGRLDTLPWLGEAPSWADVPPTTDVAAIAQAVAALIPPADAATVNVDDLARALLVALAGLAGKG